MTQLKPPHNSEWIIAYGQGHQLQWKIVHEYPWSDFRNGTPNPVTHPHLKWRIKPEPVVIEMYVAINSHGCQVCWGHLLEHVKIDSARLSTEEMIAYIKTTITDGVPTVEIVK